MTPEVTERFIILLFSVGIIYGISYKFSPNKLHPLSVLVSICAFFLCLVFIKIDMSVGIGFGLFAIFSILRFRTESFSIQAIIFLFVSITLAILNILLPIENISTILIINLIIVLAYALMSFWESKTLKNKEIYTEIICSSEGFLAQKSHEDKLMFLREKTNLSVYKFQIKSIQTMEGKVILKIYFT